MRCLVLLPVVFCSLAQAQDFIALANIDSDLNCIDEVKRFLAGEHDIEDLDFKSIKCEGTLETMAEEQS
ncbi:hypothetical protein BM221_002686 [Beauveria bassiana]|uniref:Uncharacterized protein n=1 Tax=Beauveria bassiana TaxID=176275 RepID=A0A2N6NZA6_BEABA|nr:hypothetical protein BM221_002686 [Beauveria bassiana]